jgi:hypothetical protein
MDCAAHISTRPTRHGFRDTRGRAQNKKRFRRPVSRHGWRGRGWFTTNKGVLIICITLRRGIPEAPGCPWLVMIHKPLNEQRRQSKPNHNHPTLVMYTLSSDSSTHDVTRAQPRNILKVNHLANMVSRSIVAPPTDAAVRGARGAQPLSDKCQHRHPPSILSFLDSRGDVTQTYHCWLFGQCGMR